MKIIFLDVDGVLNGNFWNETHQKEISDLTKIDMKCVHLLSELVRETGANVVMHSAWRSMFNNQMQPMGKMSKKLYDMLRSAGVTLYDRTPDFATEEIRKAKKYSLVKAKEILAYLKSHKDVDSWVVLEDLDLHNEKVSVHQVRTNQDTGLTPENIRAAKKILNNSFK